MRGLDIHENIHVSVTKLLLGLRVDFISSHLTVNKLFPVKGTVPAVIRFFFFLIMCKNCYGIGNNVLKFQVATMKIVPVARI